MTDTSNLTSQDLVDAIQERLKEQKRAIVAGLNREAELRDRKSTLRDSLEAAEHSSDRWQTRAEKAEGRVQELEGENALLEQEATADELRISRLTKERDAARAEVGRLRGQRQDVVGEGLRLKRELQEARAENERLKGNQDAKVDVLPDMSAFRREVIKGLHSTIRSLQWKLERTREERDRLRTDVRRVIRPDEWKAGQVVAIKKEWKYSPDWEWIVCTIHQPKGGGPLRFDDGMSVPQTDCGDRTVVLLADAPEDADEERPTCGCDCGCGATP